MTVYAEYRSAEGTTASTPEAWAANFANSARLTKWRETRLASWREARLVRRHVPRGARVLDAGCGFGEWVTLLRNRGYAAEGLDYSGELIERLRAEYPDALWHQGDIRKIDPAIGAFDAVISWGVIEHDPEGPGAALHEFSRILRPGGVAILTVPRDTELMRASSEAQFPRTSGAKFFQFLMTEDELAAHVREAGLTVVDTGTTRLPSLALVFPRLQASRLFGAGAMLFAFAAKWTRRYDGMIYCVARKEVNA
jgi:SAM-dependent methyltransferase